MTAPSHARLLFFSFFSFSDGCTHCLSYQLPTPLVTSTALQLLLRHPKEAPTRDLSSPKAAQTRDPPPHPAFSQPSNFSPGSTPRAAGTRGRTGGKMGAMDKGYTAGGGPGSGEQTQSPRMTPRQRARLAHQKAGGGASTNGHGGRGVGEEQMGMEHAEDGSLHMSSVPPTPRTPRTAHIIHYQAVPLSRDGGGNRGGVGGGGGGESNGTIATIGLPELVIVSGSCISLPICLSTSLLLYLTG